MKSQRDNTLSLNERSLTHVHAFRVFLKTYLTSSRMERVKSVR